MRVTVSALILALLTAVHFAAGAATPPEVARFAGTWRVVRADAAMQVRVEADGNVIFISPKDGSSMRGTATTSGAAGQTAFGGLLANGQAFAIGLLRGVPSLSLGESVLALEALDARGPESAAAQPPATSGFSLGGLRLSTAKGRNGYFSERSYDFCADGHVFTRWAESQMSQFGSGVSERMDQGTWRQNGDSLELNLARAGAVTFAVQRPEARVVRLGATAYAVERSGKCR